MIVLHPSHIKLSTIRQSEPGSVVQFISDGKIAQAIVIEAEDGAHGILYVDPPEQRNVYEPNIDERGLDLKCTSLTYHSYSIEIDESTIQDAAKAGGESIGSLAILETGPHIVTKQVTSRGQPDAGFDRIPIAIESWLPTSADNFARQPGFLYPRWRLLGILDGTSDILFDTIT